MNRLAGLALVAAAIGGGYFWLSSRPAKAPVTISVVRPELSAQALRGETVFQGTCAACHGAELTGTDNGPPLIHIAYRPAMHADYAIVSAIKNGVVAHHWRFGNMPPQPDIAEADIAPLITYIREMQKANGI